jgi:putative lipoic acid-binding regulatory protein
LGAIVKEAYFLGLPESLVPSIAEQVWVQSGLYRPEKLHRVRTQDIPNQIEDKRGLLPRTQGGLEIIGGPTRHKRLIGDGRLSVPTTPPPPRDYILEGLLLRSTPAVLAGAGGTSKTMLSIQLAIAFALGRDILEKKSTEGCSLLLLAEEDQSEAKRRVGAVCAHLGLSPAERLMVEERVRIFPLVGVDARLTAFDQKVRSLASTAFDEEIIATAQQIVSGTGIPMSLVVLDHAGIMHGGMFDAREDTAQTMRIVARIAQETKAATLLLAHSPKASASKDFSDAQDVAGSAAWTDHARAAFVLRSMTKAAAKPFGIPDALLGNYVTFSVVKNNYGPSHESIPLERYVVPNYSVSVLQPYNQIAVMRSAQPSLVDKVVKLVGDHPRQYSKTTLREKHSGIRGTLGASKQNVADAIEQALSSGRLVQVKPSAADRKAHGLKAQVREVLDTPSRLPPAAQSDGNA